MLNLADFVSRLKQVIRWNLHLSQNHIYFSERVNWKNTADYKLALQAALVERDTQSLSAEFALDDFRKLGRILCLEIVDGAPTWHSDWVDDESSVPPVDMWFALDEFSQDQEAILYCWVPKPFEQLAEQEVLSGFFWRDKRPNMFYNAVLLAIAELS